MEFWEGGAILAYDKKQRTPRMKFIDYGLGALRPRRLIGCQQDKAFDLAELYGEILAERELAGMEMKQRFYEIGSPAGLEETARFIASREWLRPMSGEMTSKRRSFWRRRREIAVRLDRESMDKASEDDRGVAQATGGRLFILGVGGSAANASHAVNDFRKITREIEAYAPTDNVSELTARTNDEGWRPYSRVG